MIQNQTRIFVRSLHLCMMTYVEFVALRVLLSFVSFELNSRVSLSSSQLTILVHKYFVLYNMIDDRLSMWCQNNGDVLFAVNPKIQNLKRDQKLTIATTRGSLLNE